jgi:hypothetical protein
MNMPEYMGGHLDKVHTDRATLLYLKQNFNITSMIDVGCGPGDMVQIARDRGIDAIGIDGDTEMDPVCKLVVHDYTKSSYIPDKVYDLGWSVEFVEHIEEEFTTNFMQTFECCKFVVITYAPPGWPGHHHVNCRTGLYWYKKFKHHGLVLDVDVTKAIRKVSVMHKPFMANRGMFFRNDRYVDD